MKGHVVCRVPAQMGQWTCRSEKMLAGLTTTSGGAGVLSWDSCSSSRLVPRFKRPEAKTHSIYVNRAVTNSRVARSSLGCCVNVQRALIRRGKFYKP